MSELAKAIKKIRADLVWRGPTGRQAGVIVLDRAMAEVVLEALEKKQKQPEPVKA